jgi:CO/xanthine dehydrogenase FAD-binding subunit
MAEVMRNPDTAALAIAAHAVGGPAIRNMATVGGNLFAAHPYGDFTTALLALDATVEWADGRSENLEQFLVNRDASTGVVAAVSVPRVSSGELRFKKVTRTRPKGVSLMSIAVRLPVASGGSPRIAFGAMGPTPLRAKAAESALAGGRITPQSAEAAAQVCVQGLAPADDALASAWYRTEVAPVHLKRLLMNDGA